MDRDGTLIEHVPYLHDPDRIVLLPGVRDAVQRLIELEVPLFIFSNQSGIGRGYFSKEDLFACQERLYALLGIEESQLAGWCTAWKYPDDATGYRKPSPRFIREACDHFAMPLGCAHMIGDQMVDVEAGRNAGVTTWYVGSEQLTSQSESKHNLGQVRCRSGFASCVEELLSDGAV